VGAVFPPCGSAVFKNNVVKRAFFCAFAAADAGAVCIKSVGLYKKTVKKLHFGNNCEKYLDGWKIYGILVTVKTKDMFLQKNFWRKQA